MKQIENIHLLTFHRTIKVLLVMECIKHHSWLLMDFHYISLPYRGLFVITKTMAPLRASFILMIFTVNSSIAISIWFFMDLDWGYLLISYPYKAEIMPIVSLARRIVRITFNNLLLLRTSRVPLGYSLFWSPPRAVRI